MKKHAAGLAADADAGIARTICGACRFQPDRNRRDRDARRIPLEIDAVSSVPMSPDDARELGRESLAVGRFLSLERIDYASPDGKRRSWEMAGRVGGGGAVYVIARLWPDRAWVLVRQYRPPARGAVWEFPAGLIDPGESPGAAALRELKEETGYVGEVRSIRPASFSSPGLTDEAVYAAMVDVDTDRPENRTPQAHPDEGECLDTLRVPFGDAEVFLDRRLAAGERFDSKVMAYLLGWIQRKHDGKAGE